MDFGHRSNFNRIDKRAAVGVVFQNSQTVLCAKSLPINAYNHSLEEYRPCQMLIGSVVFQSLVAGREIKPIESALA